MEERIYGADTHVHTVGSDGSYTLENVVEKALKAGLKYLAITDHNTVTIREPFSVNSLTVIPGVECDCSYSTESGKMQDIHVIGLFFNGVTETRLEEIMVTEWKKLDKNC